jgi:hypothetical protein
LLLLFVWKKGWYDISFENSNQIGLFLFFIKRMASSVIWFHFPHPTSSDNASRVVIQINDNMMKF